MWNFRPFNNSGSRKQERWEVRMSSCLRLSHVSRFITVGVNVWSERRSDVWSRLSSREVVKQSQKTKHDTRRKTESLHWEEEPQSSALFLLHTFTAVRLLRTTVERAEPTANDLSCCYCRYCCWKWRGPVQSWWVWRKAIIWHTHLKEGHIFPLTLMTWLSTWWAWWHLQPV